MNPPRSSLRRCLPAAGVFAGLLLSLAPLRATQGPIQGDLKVKHREAEGMVSSNADGPPDVFKSQKKDTPIKVKAKDGQEVVVRVVDPNTLLFDYKAGASTDEKTADRKVIDDFVKIIAPDIPKSDTGGADPNKYIITVGGKSIKFPGIRDDLQLVGTAYDEIPKKVNATADNPPDPNEPTPKLEAALKNVGLLLDFFEEIDSLAAVASDKNVTIDTIAADDSKTTATKSVTEFFGDDAFKDLKVVFGSRAKLRKVRDDLNSFEEDYKKFRENYKTGVIAFSKTADNSLDRKQVFDATARTTYSDKLNDVAKAHQKKFAGTYTVIVSPVQAFHVRAGLGGIYSFVEDPEFGVATSSTGVVTITKKNSDPAALGGAATVNIYHDSYWEQPLEPFVQFGYSPSSSKQGILGGIGITAFKNVQFAAGVIYQQRTALKEGQSVGMVLPKAEDLGTRKEWAAGFYVQVSLGITVGK